ncbi:hypothetical protein DUI87_20267 [Hirundo rustica rustica]|uniref:Uncharacterized protein n=1 Tax=Hirundo rustica rustica TaxID=333673 RepID=A0A3M0JVB6_HIRRU|nr:hypothetical protein DUI87_20267 [Hirundo rustica rustica]
MEVRLCFTEPWDSLIPVPQQESEEHQAETGGMSKKIGVVDEMNQKLCSGHWNCGMSQVVWDYSVVKTQSSAEEAQGAGQLPAGQEKVSSEFLDIQADGGRSLGLDSHPVVTTNSPRSKQQLDPPPSDAENERECSYSQPPLPAPKTRAISPL